MPMLMLFAGPPIVFLAAQDWAWLDRWQRQIAGVGNLTYSSYLLHFPLQLALAIAVSAGAVQIDQGSPLFLIAYIGLVLGLSALAYQRFERPVQQYLRKLTLANE